MNVILSIKPKFAEAILSGEKKFEFRKIRFKEDVQTVYIYCSSPVKKITGSFTYKNIVKDTPEKLWEKFGDDGNIDKDDFFKYFKNKKTGYSICIDSINKFPYCLDPYEIFQDFTPPQSFRYCDEIASLKLD